MNSNVIILLLIIHFSLVVLSTQCCKSKKLRSCCGTRNCNIFCCNCPCKLSCESTISGDYDADSFNLDYDKREILSKRRFHAMKIQIRSINSSSTLTQKAKASFQIQLKLAINLINLISWT